MIETANIQKLDFRKSFQEQKEYAKTVAKTNAKTRIDKIKSIEKYIQEPTNFKRLSEALYQDFRKPEAETLASETGVVLNHAKYIRKHLQQWMRNEAVPGSILMVGTSSYIRYEPKGACLIISPWNYPLNLALLPLMYAIAAGNTVSLKPSEISSHTSGYLKEMIHDLFLEQEVCVFEGGVEISQALLQLPYNHIFFTGSPQVGKIVMNAAAKNLSSVTLELGGKSPVIIDETANAKKTAQKLAWAKCFNGGQTCIAPDYALVHHSKVPDLLDHLKITFQKFYDVQGEGIQNSNDYCRIINDKHFNRIKNLIIDSVDMGAKIEIGGDMDSTDRFISPTVLTQITPNMPIMEEEIFGPVLPVISFQDKSEALEIIETLPKPLSMYIESKKKSTVKYFLENTSAGGTVINDFLLGYANPALPFGGVNNSGIGKSFGKHGFVEFSNERGIIKRNWGTMDFIFPPYTNRVKKILKTLAKWS